MNLEGLIRRFRTKARDTATPYLFGDEEVTDWLNDAQEQACIRGRLILEDAAEEVIRIDLTPGTGAYALHESVYEIVTAHILWPGMDRDDIKPLSIVTREWLNKYQPKWREDSQPARWAIQDDTRIRIVGTFPEDAWLQLECYRLPLYPMVSDADEPEIHRAHHEHLIDWALHEAYSIPDTEVFDPEKSRRAEAEFTTYFGPLPDSGLRRETRHDFVQVNEVIA